MEQMWLPFPDDEYRPKYPEGIHYSQAFLELLQRNTSLKAVEEGNKEARKRGKKAFDKGQTIYFRNY